MKLKKLLFWVLAACTVAPVLVSASFLMYSSSRRERDLIIENMEMSANLFSNSIENFFEVNRTDMVVTFNGPLLQRFIRNGLRTDITKVSEKDVITNTFKARVKLSESVSTVSVLDANGMVLLSSDPFRVGKRTFMGDEKLDQLRRSKKPVVSNSFIYSDSDSPPHFLLAIPLLNDDQYCGALVFVMSTSFIQQMVTKAEFFKSYPSGFITVLDARGRIVATTNKSMDVSDYIQKYINEEAERTLSLDGRKNIMPGDVISFSSGGIDRIGYYYSVSDTGWKILCSVSESELLRPVRQITNVSILLISILIVVVTLIFVALTKQLMGPMSRLLDAIRRMRHGDSMARFVYDKDDEFGEIAAAYNDLVDKTQSLIKKEKLRSEFLLDKSNHDPLTGLYNKAATEELISQYLMEGGHHALYIMDIDKFKNVNDTYGHTIGDKVIKAVANRIKAISRDSDVAGRIGGDEYMLFLKDIRKPETLEIKAREIWTAFHEAAGDVPEVASLSGSIGCALFPRDGMTFAELYKAADQALYNTKEHGRDGWTIYERSIGDGNELQA